MNVERLHSLLLNAIDDMMASNTPEQLLLLRQSTEQLANNPQNADLQREFSSHRNELMESLRSAPSNSFSAGVSSDLESLNIAPFLGNTLADRIDSILAQHELTFAVAADQLMEIQSAQNDLSQSLAHAVVALESLGIAREEPGPGDVEASVILPRSSVQNSLGSLGTEFRELERVFADMTEIATGSRPPTALRSIAASDFSVYLGMAPAVAAFFAMAVERVVALYRNLLEIRRIRSEAAAQGIRDAQLEGIDRHIEQHMDEGLDGVVEELLSEATIGVSDESRINELKISLKKTLMGIAARIDRGYRFDVRFGELADDDDSDETEEGASRASALEIIADSREGFTYLRLEGDPILELPRAEPDDMEQD